MSLWRSFVNGLIYRAAICASRQEPQSLGPYSIQRELSLTRLVGLDTRCPPTFVGTQDRKSPSAAADRTSFFGGRVPPLVYSDISLHMRVQCGCRLRRGCGSWPLRWSVEAAKRQQCIQNFYRQPHGLSPMWSIYSCFASRYNETRFSYHERFSWQIVRCRRFRRCRPSALLRKQEALGAPRSGWG